MKPNVVCDTKTKTKKVKSESTRRLKTICYVLRQETYSGKYKNSYLPFSHVGNNTGIVVKSSIFLQHCMWLSDTL